MGICIISLDDWIKKLIVYDLKRNKLILIQDPPRQLDNYGNYSQQIQTLTTLFRTFHTGNMLPPKPSVEFPLLADIYSNSIQRGKVFRINTAQKNITIVNGNMLFNLIYSKDTVLEQGKLPLEGDFVDINFGSNLLITVVSRENQSYNVYSANPAKLLMRVTFSNSKARFELPNGEYAEFFTINNEERPLADIVSNRPDMILSLINPKASNLINLYSKVVELRLKKVFQSNINSINPDSIFYKIPPGDLPPKASLSGDRFEKVILDSNFVTINFNAGYFDEGFDRFNIWVNGVPQYGYEGQSFADVDSPVISRKVFLSKGRNNIQVAARTSTLIWGPKDSYICHYLPAEIQQSKIYFVGRCV